MRQYKKRWQLKNTAKDLLTGNYSEAVLFTFIYGLFVIADYIISSVVMCSFSEGDILVNLLFSNYNATGYAAGLAVSFCTGIVLRMFTAGISLYFLNIASGQGASLRDLFFAFLESPNKYLILSLIILSVQTLFSLPGYICSFLYIQALQEGTPSSLLGLLSTFLRYAGLAAALPITLGWSQCFRLSLDFPSLSVGEMLSRSRKLMRGHRCRLFILTLSFLPLEIAALFTAGIGFLWLFPYMNMTYTLFYFDLMDTAQP